MDYQNQTVRQMKNNLKALNAMELQELDEIITPRSAELLAKAFGNEIYDLLAPLTENDEPELGEEAHDNEFSEPRYFEDEKESGSENGLRKMMRDPRYWRERDPETVRKVTKGFKNLYPSETN